MPAAQTDRDLASIADARALARKAKIAQAVLAEFSQAQIDAIVTAMATAVTLHAEPLARLAVEETTFGVVADKVQKNLFASEQVFEFIKPMKTVGVVNRLEDRRVIEIAEPFGVVAAIVPSIVTVVIQPIEPSGAPAPRAASFMISATRVMHFTADGCGLMTIAHRAFSAMRIL